jgi:hypothetical protein
VLKVLFLKQPYQAMNHAFKGLRQPASSGVNGASIIFQATSVASSMLQQKYGWSGELLNYFNPKIVQFLFRIPKLPVIIILPCPTLSHTAL